MSKKMTMILILIIVILFACSEGNGENNNADDNVKASGMPIVEETIELDFFARQPAVSNDDWNDVLVYNEYEDMTNIKVNWHMNPDNVVEEKLNLSLGGGDVPDAYHTTFISDNDMMKYGEQGLFIPLNDLIDEYAPNFKQLLEDNPVIEKQITYPDGNIYGFPMVVDEDFFSYRTREKPWINAKWLDNLGLNMPETTEAFYEFLKAAKEGNPTGNDQDDVIPYGGREILPLFNYLKGSFGVANKGVENNNVDLDPETNEMRFYPISEDYKKLLDYMHKIYKEELIAQNIFSIDDEQYRANVGEGQYGSTVFYNPEISVGGDHVNDFVGMPALEGPDGKKEFVTMISEVVNISAFVITDENEHPEATVRWVDHFYGEDGMKLFFMGVEGETYEINDDGEVEFMDHIINSDEGNTVQQEQSKYLTFHGGGFPSIINEEYFQGAAESSEKSIKAGEKLAPNVVKDPWPSFIYTNEETKKLDAFGKDINKYVLEMQDKFISGETSLDEWDKYVDTIKNMQLDEYMEIKEAALERYQEN